MSFQRPFPDRVSVPFEDSVDKGAGGFLQGKRRNFKVLEGEGEGKRGTRQMTVSLLVERGLSPSTC